MMSFSFQELLDWCEDLDTAIDLLGSQTLAPWLLKPELADHKTLIKPRIPDLQGCATGLFLMEPPGELALPNPLSKEFILPFQWKTTEPGDSPYLPQGIGGTEGIAGNIRKAINTSLYMGQADSWTLHFADSLGDANLSGLKFDANSLEAPLIASLLISLHGGKPKPNVFSTGHWTPAGMNSIEGVTRKIDALLTLKNRGGFDDDPILFVPADNFSEAQVYTAEQQSSLKIKSYPSGEPNLEKCFREQLQLLDAPPTKSAALPERLRYANRPYIRTQKNERRSYYLDNLLEDLAEKLRQDFSEKRFSSASSARTCKVERMLLPVSFSFELSALLLCALRPHKALFLYTNDSKKDLDALRSYIPKGITTDEISLEEGREQHSLKKCINFFREKSPIPTEEALYVIDITAGTKEMTAIAMAVALKNNASILYLKHKYEDGSPTFGAEKLALLDWLQNDSIPSSTLMRGD